MMEPKTLETKGLGRYPLMFGGVVFVIGALLALNVIGLRGSRDAEALQIVGLGFIVISLLFMVWGLRLLSKPKGLVMTETGFRDAQMFRNEIAWTSLQAIENGKSNNGREEAIRLRVTPEAYKASGLRLLAKLVMADPKTGIGYTDKMVAGPLDQFGQEIHGYANEALQRAA